MKRVLLFAFSAILIAGMWSCEKTKKEDATLELDPATNIVFDIEGETVKIKVTTNQDVWDAKSDQTWCEVTKGTGEFTLTVKANESEEAMPQAVITVTAGEGDNVVTKTIKADQPGIDAPVIPEVTMTNFFGYYFGDELRTNSTMLGLTFYNGDLTDSESDYEALFVTCFNDYYHFENLAVQTGIYTPNANGGVAGTYIPGVNEDELGTVYAVKKGSESKMYLVKGGDMKLEANGANYTLTATLKIVDIAGSSAVEEDIKINFSGTLTDRFRDDEFPEEGDGKEYVAGHLKYYEVISTESLGYYQFEFLNNVMGFDGMFLSFYNDLVTVDNKGDLKVPTGTFRFNPSGTASEWGDIVPGEAIGPWDQFSRKGTYTMYAVDGNMVSLLMKHGKIWITEPSTGVYSVTVKFDAYNPANEETFEFVAFYTGTPYVTYVQSDKEKYTTTFTKVKDANIIDVGNEKSYMLRMALTDETESKEINIVGYINIGDNTITEGTYTFDNNLPAHQDPMTLAGGTYSTAYGLGNTYYTEASDGEYKVAMPASGGKMEVSYDGTNYTISFDFEGVNERASRKEAVLKGTYSGPIDITIRQ